MMPIPGAIEAELAAVYRLYAALVRHNSPESGSESSPESGLGGKLLFAGELDLAGCRLVRAANIAGAATLASAADPLEQRQAIREGAVDFLVNSLDEALRILKNEIRKHQAVAVAVAAAPSLLLDEMLDRGVLPDLLPPAPFSDASQFARFLAQGAQQVEIGAEPAGRIFLTLSIPAEFAQRPAEFEACLASFLPPGDHPTRRWLRLSPRYLNPDARRIRSLACDEATARRIRRQLASPHSGADALSL